MPPGLSYLELVTRSIDSSAAEFARGPVRDLEIAQRPTWARRLSDSTRFHDRQSRRLAGWPCA